MPREPLTEEEVSVLTAIPAIRAVDVDHIIICAEAQLSPIRTAANLMVLEMKGYVRRLPGATFERTADGQALVPARRVHWTISVARIVQRWREKMNVLRTERDSLAEGKMFDAGFLSGQVFAIRLMSDELARLAEEG
jgi:hypothetical protein